MIDEKQLAEWELVERMASKGPWLHRGSIPWLLYDPPGECVVGTYREIDAAFCSCSREAVPALIAEVRRLTQERDEARRAHCVALCVASRGGAVGLCDAATGHDVDSGESRLWARAVYGAAEADRLFPCPPSPEGQHPATPAEGDGKGSLDLGTLENRWRSLGWVVGWSEVQPRAYEIARVGDEGVVLARFPTVQQVYEWIDTQGRR